MGGQISKMNGATLVISLLMAKEEKEYNRPRSFGKIKFIDGLIMLVIFTHFKNVTCFISVQNETSIALC